MLFRPYPNCNFKEEMYPEIMDFLTAYATIQKLNGYHIRADVDGGPSKYYRYQYIPYKFNFHVQRDNGSARCWFKMNLEHILGKKHSIELHFSAKEFFDPSGYKGNLKKTGVKWTMSKNAANRPDIYVTYNIEFETAEQLQEVFRVFKKFL